MNWKSLDTPPALQEFIRTFDWHDAFIRECYLLTPSYIDAESRHWITVGDLPDARVLVTGQSEKTPAVELVFRNVEALQVQFNCDLSPRAELQKHRLLWAFESDFEWSVECSAMQYRSLGKEALGSAPRYGKLDATHED